MPAKVFFLIDIDIPYISLTLIFLFQRYFANMPPLSPIPPSPLPSNTSPMSLKSSSPISVSPNEVSILQRLGSINSSRLGSQRYHPYITSAYVGWVGLENDPFLLMFSTVFRLTYVGPVRL